MDSVFAKWIEQFSNWPPMGQAVFILIILSGAATFITTLIRGYPRFDCEEENTK